MDNNFSGKNGFIWWVGIVENRLDPLAMGRCQVRILGWHNTDKAQLPTEGLPWAHPMYAINTSKMFSSPKLNDSLAKSPINLLAIICSSVANSNILDITSS
jgi:hypothetical protein